MQPQEEQAPAPERLARVSVSALDEVLGRAFPVLDDGFVRVVDYMGDDRAIVQAARVSYGDGTKKGSDDAHLIRYLMRHRHSTPFEMCEIKLHVRAPMDVWRQWVRHRTASINEYSTRYSLAIDAARSLAPDEWRTQSSTNRQGSAGLLPPDEGAAFTADEKEFHAAARALYEKRVEAGVAREIARKDLPLATYTEAYWKCNLRNLLHFLSLRMPAAAQYEIRAYAETIGREIVARWVPLAWKAFEDYELSAASLSAPDVSVVSALVRGGAEAAASAALAAGMLRREPDGSLKVLREGAELSAKIAALGFAAPW
ncbi:MAG: FAD-dependent thymidylate synthase [Kiritimatiellae bacterium]|nr:FAD-dependent thymidylate synthase [Kiritimatiellia bacterium]